MKNTLFKGKICYYGMPLLMQFVCESDDTCWLFFSFSSILYLFLFFSVFSISFGRQHGMITMWATNWIIFVYKQNQNCLLVTCQNDNHSPGPGRLVPSSHQRSKLSNSILGTFSRGDKTHVVWKCIPIPNGLGEKATLLNISISNADLICRRMMIPAGPNQEDKVICCILTLPFKPLYNNMSTVSSPFL